MQHVFMRVSLNKWNKGMCLCLVGWFVCNTFYSRPVGCGVCEKSDAVNKVTISWNCFDGIVLAKNIFDHTYALHMV